MLYRRSVNKLMHRAILPLSSSSPAVPRSPFPSSGLMSRPVYALKSLILIHPPPWISTIRDLATNRRLFLLDRPRLMIRYAEERVADLAGGRKGGWSRKSDRMSTTNLSAILREFFPWQRATSGENRALRLHSLINMQIWRHGVRLWGREGVRDDSRGKRKKERERERKREIKRERQRGPWASSVVGDGRGRRREGGLRLSFSSQK